MHTPCFSNVSACVLTTCLSPGVEMINVPAIFQQFLHHFDPLQYHTWPPPSFSPSTWIFYRICICFWFYPWIFIILTPYRIPYMTPTQNFALYLNLLSNLIFHEIDFIDFPWESWKIYKISWNFAVKKMYALIPPSGDMKKPEKSM